MKDGLLSINLINIHIYWLVIQNIAFLNISIVLIIL